MQEFDLAKKVLDDVVDQDTPFSEALRKVFQNDVNLRPMRNLVAGLLGCELRHHLLFSYLTEPLTDFDVAEKRYLSLALADAYFFKRIPLDQLQAILLEKLGPDKMKKAQVFLDKAGKTDEYIPPEIPKTSNKYLSLRYNTPEWVLKIWEHYGYGTTYKILKKNNRQNTTSVRVRTSICSVEELLNNNPDYAKTNVEGVLCYGGKVPLRKLAEAHGLVHRDIKPDNLFYLPDGSVKIADFGISSQLNEPQLGDAVTGTIYYTAPEILMILAGGKGTRLQALTKKVAKPAVSYGGKYRIIDFPLSNCANSGITCVGVLTQYESSELNTYVGNGEKWGLNGVRSLTSVLTPKQTDEGSNWYLGTADAIYQNIDWLDRVEPEYVLILSGDHVYSCTYDAMWAILKATPRPISFLG